MENIGYGLLIVFVYPIVVAFMVAGRHTQRIEELERQLAILRDSIQHENKRPAVVYDVEAPPAPASTSDTKPPSPAQADTESADWYAELAQNVDTTVYDKTVESADVGPSRAPKIVVASTHKEPEADPAAPPSTPAPDYPAADMPAWLLAAKNWLLTGNLVAKLGLVILFIGVGFLLKYVAATVTIPIELRLAGVVLADLGLLAWGWRLRSTRREIGLPIQGTAIAILMLVIFGAYQRYELIPAGFAFALLVSLTAFTCLLAVLQNAIWLAAFGITGGFACPLLLSTGQGSHVGLFSYYALLNAGVFWLAIKRSWRLLNLLGFAFTFIVGTAWGGLRYTPDNYLSAQAFLILFFLFYVGIPIAFARQQQARTKEYVDAVLVLATPLLAFGLQVGLVKDKPFGIALSALALGGFYMLLGTILLRRGTERWRLMVEAYVAAGVIFGTLAIPFALDGRWTSAAWAVEGVGLAWLGLRRQQRSVWIFGLLLQVAAWWSFLAAATGLDPVAARTANLWLSFLLLAGSAFAIAIRLRKHAGDAAAMPQLAGAGLTLAAAWMVAGGWTEAVLRLSGSMLSNWLVIVALFTTALLYVVGVRLAWQLARYLSLGVQVLVGAALGIIHAPDWSWTMPLEAKADQPLLGIVMLAISAVVTSRLLQRMEPGHDGRQLATPLLLCAGFWWFGPAINIIAWRSIDYLPAALGEPFTRWFILYAMAVGITTVACVRFAARLAWPQLRWLAGVCWVMLALFTAQILHTLYGWHALPDTGILLTWVILWASGEYALTRWRAGGPELHSVLLKLLHLLRTGAPWLALWPAGAIVIDTWLGEGQLAQDNWVIDASWSNYLPTWAMMLVLVVLLRRSLAGGWPTAPLAGWYRTVVIPGATVLLAALAATWNLNHDGAMAPLPYLPLLNPLDLTTGFVLVLCVGAVRQLAGLAVLPDGALHRVRVAGFIAAYAWFNLILLRGAAHYLGIGYWLPDLAASQFVQAMLSLVWSASALVLMRVAARRTMPRTWWSGALVLGIVVLKLFVVDLANGGSIARVVSFVGVGLLLLLVGYLAPFPKTAQGAPAVATA